MLEPENGRHVEMDKVEMHKMASAGEESSTSRDGRQGLGNPGDQSSRTQISSVIIVMRTKKTAYSKKTIHNKR